MSAEVFPETAYVASCEECNWQGEIQEYESDATHEMEAHNTIRPDVTGEERDDRTDREKWQDSLDVAMVGGVA